MREPGFWHGPASLNAHLLKPLAALYGAVAAQRLRRQGLNAGIPVLCVGNYHVGGAGKTPTVMALAKLLRELGETPVVLSRGYGGKLAGPVRVDPVRHAASDVGDEPLMLAGALPVVVSRKRADGVPLARSVLKNRVGSPMPANASTRRPRSCAITAASGFRCARNTGLP